MKILIVDDEHSFGSLLGRTLKRLGHKPVITAHPHDALAVLDEQSVDAVITDIDMPMMNGVELARAIRDRDPAVPIAFCTGSNHDEDVAVAAREIGDVLPKVWTVSDVKDVVAGLKLARPRLARGSQADLPPVERRRMAALGRRSMKRNVVRKIKVSCRTWDQVDKLVEQQAQGRSMLTLRGSHRLKPRERLTVALSLPDELVLSIAAEVATVRRDENGGGVFIISLCGMTPEVCVRLRAMSQSASGPRRPSAYNKRISRAKSPEVIAEDTDVSNPGAVLGNLRLRKQIETMADKMRPSERDLKEYLKN
jgi:CheY-like chemotaxis protein